MTICIGCGCHDEHACVGIDQVPCHWLREDMDTTAGVCSHCPDDVARFDNGDRRMYEGPTQDDGHGHFDDDSSLILPGDDDFDETLDLLD